MRGSGGTGSDVSDVRLWVKNCPKGQGDPGKLYAFQMACLLDLGFRFFIGKIGYRHPPVPSRSTRHEYPVTPDEQDRDAPKISSLAHHCELVYPMNHVLRVVGNLISGSVLWRKAPSLRAPGVRLATRIRHLLG